MTIELKVPEVGESVREVEILNWLKEPGDSFEEDDNLVEVETDKASVEIPAPVSGVIVEILKKPGEIAEVGEVIAHLESEDGKPEPSAKRDEQKAKAPKPKKEKAEEKPAEGKQAKEKQAKEKEAKAEKAAEEEKQRAKQEKPSPEPSDEEPAERKAPAARDRPRHETSDEDAALEDVKPMSLIRRRIARRLVDAQQTAALLTTFNEIDMSEVMQLRKEYREEFIERYGVKLGFMSFFVKAAVDALSHFPEINAEIRGDDVAYRNYYNIGVAIGGGKGLVVPVLRHAEMMSFAEIERKINEYAERARANHIKPEELQGGTFTITNGGVYGSLLSTPIINPPQSGILGMHAIQERPVAIDGQVVIRPMMYVALTYDHRIVDGEQAVRFLIRIKEVVEEPSRMLLEA